MHLPQAGCLGYARSGGPGKRPARIPGSVLPGSPGAVTQSPRPPSRLSLSVVAVLALALHAVPAQAAGDDGGKQAQLDALKAKLAKVQQTQEDALQKRDAVQVELHQSERAIAAPTCRSSLP